MMATYDRKVCEPIFLRELATNAWVIGDFT